MTDGRLEFARDERLTPAEIIAHEEAAIAEPFVDDPPVMDEPAVDDPPVDDTDPPAAPVASLTLAEVLPADFPLPTLIKFIPDPRLRLEAQAAAAAALLIAVEGAGPDGLQAADAALIRARSAIAAIEAEFSEPTKVAYELHRRLTGLRGEWTEQAYEAVQTVGQRMYRERRRLDALAAEERRKAQEDANRLEREARAREADAAKAAGAPKAAVRELEQQAKTAQAPPVPAAATQPAKLAGSTSVTFYRCRIAGTPPEADQNPAVEFLSQPQLAKLFEFLRAVLDGHAPIAAIDINWPYLNERAKREKTTFKIPGFESYETGGTRAKGRRG